jgi:hypothetical protein
MLTYKEEGAIRKARFVHRVKSLYSVFGVFEADESTIFKFLV